jgi:hypothetical protein
MFQRQAMRRTAVIAIIVVLVGLLLFVFRRPQVWMGHEKIQQNSFNYAGQFSSLKACRSEVEKYGGVRQQQTVGMLEICRPPRGTIDDLLKIGPVLRIDALHR